MASLGERVAGYARMLIAFLGIIFLLAGISLQFFSAGNLYGIRLKDLCRAHSGSEELSDTKSFEVVVNAILDKRFSCLTNPNQADKELCCKTYRGLCTRPEIADLSQYDPMPANEKIALLTTVLGVFIGVTNPAGYDTANPEFYCKNCPNDWRSNCPFDPIDSQTNATGFQVDAVCQCPGGRVSAPGQAFWSTIQDNILGSKYILCSDKADVYESWLRAIFPSATSGWRDEQYQHARSRFEAKCFQGKSGTGYILSVGPVLALLSGIFSIASLHSYVASTPIPMIGFNLGMIAAALTFIAGWALSFTGASSLISRYALCGGMEPPVVLNKTVAYGSKVRAAPQMYNGAPCFDMNSEGQWANNPFIEQLAYFNGAYASGGVLVILSLICMLAITSKVSDVVMEKKLQENNPQPQET